MKKGTNTKYLLLLDYDGTLTPLVKRPEAAILSSGRREILRQLASRQNVKMAIISGRKLSEIKKLVNIPRIIYAGNHGFEIEVGGKYFVHPTAKRFTPVLKQVKAELKEKIKIKGVLIENKKYTLSVHFRRAAVHRLNIFRYLFYRAMKPWRGKAKITRGKKVFEIRPPVNWDKGKAVKWIIKKLNLKKFLPIYIGDDQTDEDAFRVLKRKGMTILVGQRKRTFAQKRLRNIGEVYDFLTARGSNIKFSSFRG